MWGNRLCPADTSTWGNPGRKPGRGKFWKRRVFPFLRKRFGSLQCGVVRTKPCWFLVLRGAGHRRAFRLSSQPMRAWRGSFSSDRKIWLSGCTLKSSDCSSQGTSLCGYEKAVERAASGAAQSPEVNTTRCRQGRLTTMDRLFRIRLILFYSWDSANVDLPVKTVWNIIRMTYKKWCLDNCSSNHLFCLVFPNACGRL